MTRSDSSWASSLRSLAGTLSTYVSSTPTVLSLSYEKRTLLRYKVLDILVSRGVLKKGIRMGHLTMSEKKFAERYVSRYQEVIPEVLEAYRARTGCAVK